jgi:geranylgeranyl pyrophosphate synthase
MTGTEAIALDWLKVDGKRLRPFITVAAYAVAKYGSNVLEPDFETADLVSLSIKRLALAIEAMHKASLVHDDIEDEDEFRYGRRTVHRRYGIAPAVNVGDYLVGLGYRLVAGEASALGADCVSDILGHLSAAHLDLCRGQGAELLWEGPSIRPIDALRIYSLKTAPAFHVALYSGLRAAGLEVDTALLTQFCTYIGEGYQILNDLEDWDADDANHTVPGLDAIAGRPTILRAFAMEAGGGEALGKLLNPEYQSDPAAVAVGVGKLYAECGAFAKAETLLERLRDRAFDLSTKMGPPALQELMSFLVRIVLPKRSAAWAGWMNERKVS